MTDPRLAPITAFAVTVLVLWALLRPGAARLPLDMPNARSLHGRPVPRLGGLGVMIGLAAGALVAGQLGTLMMLALVLAAVSFADDLDGLPVLARLACHALASCAFLAWTYQGQPWWWSTLLFLGIVWMTNLYNFMDGSDGLAGGMALIGFGAYAAAAWIGREPALAALFASISAGGAGFLLFNFPPARTFLGDSGSVPLGFLAGAGGVMGWLLDLWPLWFPLLVFSPFAVDATVTLLKRVARGELVWQAHRDHYYQRLVRLGWGHRGTALAEYGLMLACATAALFALGLERSGRVATCVAAAAVYVALIAAVELVWRARGGVDA